MLHVSWCRPAITEFRDKPIRERRGIRLSSKGDSKMTREASVANETKEKKEGANEPPNERGRGKGKLSPGARHKSLWTDSMFD